MRRMKLVSLCIMMLASLFTTGCDVQQVMDVIQRVAQGVQQAAPAIQQAVNAVQQIANPNNNNNNTAAAPANNAPPAETNTPNNNATVTIPNAGDAEDVQPARPAANATPPQATLPAAAGGREAGSAFMTRTANMSRAQKDQAIIDAITSGNMPDFLRSFRDVTVTKTLSDGRSHTITYKVMPDYLAVGSNDDFVRVPMSSTAAQRIAERFNCILPTTQMVDDIYRNAQTRLAPQPLPAGANMTSNQYFVDHQRRVEQAASTAGHTNGRLIAGHKKDIVISNRLDRNPGRVAIYGWHQTNGRPIQSLSTVHEAAYADYSHGVRLIQKTVVVDGREMNIEDVLRDPVLSGLLSNEGVIRNASAAR